VSRDIQRPIRLEVTVPIIALPSLSEQAQQTEANETPEAVEQVRLLSLDFPAQRRSTATPISQEIARGESSVYTTRTGLFRLFQFTATLIPQKLYLLQVLRAAKTQKRKLATPESAPSDPTEQLAFSLEYRYQKPDEPSPEQKVDIPGSTHVVIYLDEESIPHGYCVDGVEW
jgi:hypothetical protein